MAFLSTETWPRTTTSESPILDGPSVYHYHHWKEEVKEKEGTPCQGTVPRIQFPYLVLLLGSGVSPWWCRVDDMPPSLPGVSSSSGSLLLHSQAFCSFRVDDGQGQAQ